MIKNPLGWEAYGHEILPVSLLIQYNDWSYNRGVFAISLGLSAYAERTTQYLLFTRNFVRYNRIREPFDSPGQTSESTRLV